MSNIRKYEPFYNKGREKKLAKVEEAYKRFLETKTFEWQPWLYGNPIGKLITVEVEDCPRFGETAYMEMDSARTALMVVDMQTDFCGKGGYVDIMGYSLDPNEPGTTANAIAPIKKVLDCVRKTDISVVHTREGHEPDLSDAPFNKVLRSKIIGNGIGIGDVIPGGGGRLLVRGEPTWDIIPELYPQDGETVIDKAGKGAFLTSAMDLVLKSMGVTHIILCGIITDVCVHSILRELNDCGYWVTLMKDGVGSSDYNNHMAAIKSVKMQGGVFGNVTDSDHIIAAIEAAGLVK